MSPEQANMVQNAETRELISNVTNSINDLAKVVTSLATTVSTLAANTDEKTPPVKEDDKGDAKNRVGADEPIEKDKLNEGDEGDKDDDEDDTKNEDEGDTKAKNTKNSMELNMEKLYGTNSVDVENENENKSFTDFSSLGSSLIDHMRGNS